MALQGQNFRIYTYDSTTEKLKVIGMATSCTVSLNNNTEEASHKDIVGMFNRPEVTSKGWQVSVDSLDVADVGALLTAIKNRTKFVLMWGTSSNTDNQSILYSEMQRRGDAYLTDATFQFDDRTNSTKSLQFTGVSQLEKVSQASMPTVDVITPGNYTKGQFVRLFLGSDNTATPAAVIAAAKSLSLHVSVSLESAETKDTTGDWTIQVPTSMSYDISTTALVYTPETITSSVTGQKLTNLIDIYEAGTPVKFQIANVSGDNNRTKGSVIVSGSVIVQSITVNGPNRQNADYSAQLQSVGDYTVGS